MSDQELFFALLRVNAAQILRFSGIAGARPSVLDAFTDIIARYVILLGTTTREITELSNRTSSELPDARSALEHVGLLLPYTTNPDDTRAIDSFIAWAKSEEIAELRRVAGMQLREDDGSAIPTTTTMAEAEAVGIDGDVEGEQQQQQKKKQQQDEGRKVMMDWMTSIQQRDGRGPTTTTTTTTAATTTGSEDITVDKRYKGTSLGPPMDPGKVVIEGGDAIKWKIGNE